MTNWNTETAVGTRWGVVLLVGCALGLCGMAARADTGANWKLVRLNAEWSARYYHASAVHGGKMWVMGGATDGSANSVHDVWSSADGITWTQVTAAAPWPARNLFKALSYNGKLWVMGGIQSSSGSTVYTDVWNSTDGQSWTPVTSTAQFGGRFGFGAVVHGGKMYVMGGHNGASSLRDVWSSTDGSTWTQVTAAAPWSARTDITAAEYNNQIWIVGGYIPGSGTELHDVWSSSDGQAWTQVTSGAAWSARDSGGVEVYDGRLWLMGGFPTSADVWSTANGSSWTQSTGGAEWPARFGQTALAFGNKLWSLGGVGDSTLRNDVWYTSADGAIIGRVTDSVTHAGIGCATVVALAGSPAATHVTTADVNGDFRLDDLSTGSIAVTAYAPGYANGVSSLSLTSGERATVNFALAQATVTNGVRGVVTDSATHAPIPGIRVVAKIGGSAVATTYTCAEGEFEMRGLVAKATSVTLEYSGDAYTTGTQTVQVSAGSVTQADKSLTKSVPAPGALAGVVLRKGSNATITGARVTIEGLGDVNTTTVAGGVYAFAALPEGTYTVRASALGYGGQTQNAVISALGTTPLDFTLPLAPPGDIDQNSAVDAVDVQLVINAALSLPGSFNCDVSKDGSVDAIDVQQVINAVLGL